MSSSIHDPEQGCYMTHQGWKPPMQVHPLAYIKLVLSLLHSNQMQARCSPAVAIHNGILFSMEHMTTPTQSSQPRWIQSTHRGRGKNSASPDSKALACNKSWRNFLIQNQNPFSRQHPGLIESHTEVVLTARVQPKLLLVAHA